nr:caspase-3-like isoform X2 [Zootoca vivipara]
MASQTKSRALIIVNYKFHGRNAESGLIPRPGARREADRIFKALSKCHYAVKLRFDLTAKEIEELYEEECHADHGECFVSILSSHGEEGIIYDCEGQPVQLTRIFRILEPERCHKLAGKPKIFFIQACRGEEIDQGVWLQTDSGGAQTECFSHYLSVPQDTAVMYSCSPVSERACLWIPNCWDYRVVEWEGTTRVIYSNPLQCRNLLPNMGLEPKTLRLRVSCSTD